MKKLILTLLLTIWSSVGMTLTDGRVLLEGTVKSFDQQTVTLISGNKTVVIPRRLIAISDLKSGAKIRVEIPKSEVGSVTIGR